MNNSLTFNTNEIAESIKGRKPPYNCPACQKIYRSATGLLYHIGQIGPPIRNPRCLLGENSPHPSPVSRSCPGSPGGTPGTARRRVPKRELTWAEAQRLVEVEFENTYRRVEIDKELDMSLHSEEEGEGSCNKGHSSNTRTHQPAHKRGRGSKGETPNRSSKAKNKGKRKSKLKTPGKGNDGIIPLPKVEVSVLDNEDSQNAPGRESSYFRFVAQTTEDLDEMIEYDIDEEDSRWLSLLNEERRAQGHTVVPQEVFELIMDRLEKECCFESHSLQDGAEPFKNMYNIDENAVCCICNDGECHNTNAILFCDMCNLAVHQECYGVPYIPEGQWLCRRCLQSPSRSVDCALCPNKGGGFKQTVDGRWAHVICAIWIPEVQFSNPVFLEPIDGINDIPSARWKLTCYICRNRMGASIQCAKANCYVAFHVTCAQHASLHMKVAMGKNGEIVKTAYCDTHTPPAVKKKMEKAMEKEKLERGEDDSSSSSESEQVDGATEEPAEGEEVKIKESKAIKKARKKMAERRNSMAPIVNIPYIPQHRLDRIVTRINLHRKSQFIPRLVSYWKLKRQSRNGVPLLRRLQANNKGQRTSIVNLTDEELEVISEQLTLWKTLRHDLERARMLVELVRKREKLKREQLRYLYMINDLQLRPLAMVMKRILDRLGRKDPADIFGEPVSLEEVPDYLDVIKHPMDFSTMRKKVENNQYSSLDGFEEDFYHVWHNATIYNQADTIYCKAALRIRDAGSLILQQARDQLASAGVSSVTGLHEPEVQEPPPLTPNALAQASSNEHINLLEEHDTGEPGSSGGGGGGGGGFRPRNFSTTSLSMDEQVEILQEQLELAQAQYTGTTKRTRVKSLKRELVSVRRQQKNQQKKARNSDTDEPPNSPRRRRAPSIPRNAEELASHLIHGSLRMTASRQQILSHSGIKLEERANALQEEEREKERLKQTTETETQNNDVFVQSKGVVVSSDGEYDSNTVESSDYESESDSKSNIVPRKRTRSASSSSKRPIKPSSAPIKKSTSDSRVAAVSHKRKRAPTNRQNGSSRSRSKLSDGIWGSESQPEDVSGSRHSKRRQRLNSSGAYATSTSEVEPEATVNGFNTSPPPSSFHTTATPKLNAARHIMSMPSIGNMTRTRRQSNSSSQYETGGEGYSSEHLSDGHRIPSASSLEDLTASDVVHKRKLLKRAGQKRRSGYRSGSEKKKKKRLTSESSDAASLGGELVTARPVNGLVVNGEQQNEIKPLDLVWAKCRGYPSYPALVIDPDIPKKGLTINGEKIQAPSGEVLELRGAHPTCTYLVRFFDGRRSWQWLPPEKIEPLGVSEDSDQGKMALSGNSKRSVKEAYSRAMKYQKRVSRQQVIQESNNDSSTDVCIQPQKL